MTPVETEPRRRRVAFCYLGRNPAFGTFVFEFAVAAACQPSIDCEFLVAAGTELAEQLRQSGIRTFALPIKYRLPIGHAVLGYFSARRKILGHLHATRPDAVVTLMPHIWSPLLGPQIKRRGITYATTIHDAAPHPGDPTARVTGWLASDATHADVAFALSRSVASQIETRSQGTRVIPLFHPDIGANRRHGTSRTRTPHRPFRILFFGRILAYKGLSILIEAVEQLRAEKLHVDVGIAGWGSVAALRPRLDALGVRIIERWVPSEELPGLLADYDAMACSHVEASQSGVAALAFGHGMPVIATPVGGLAEQVIDGQTGVLATDTSATAFADAIRRLIVTEGLYDAIARNIIATAPERSMERFVQGMLAALRLEQRDRTMA